MPTTLTKKQIIIETIEYIHKNGRAKSGDHCLYNTVDGKQCAFGRCMDMRKYSKDYEGQDVHVFEDENGVDDFLKSKYHGHGVRFWSGLQHLHDYDGHWHETETGLKITDDARVHVHSLLSEYGIDISTEELHEL